MMSMRCSVTFFALINDKENKVNVILDHALFQEDLVGFHPLENTATTVVKPEDLVNFANQINHIYQIMNFETFECY